MSFFLAALEVLIYERLPCGGSLANIGSYGNAEGLKQGVTALGVAAE
jgi:hypothetical protein